LGLVLVVRAAPFLASGKRQGGFTIKVIYKRDPAIFEAYDISGVPVKYEEDDDNAKNEMSIEEVT